MEKTPGPGEGQRSDEKAIFTARVDVSQKVVVADGHNYAEVGDAGDRGGSKTKNAGGGGLIKFGARVRKPLSGGERVKI